MKIETLPIGRIKNNIRSVIVIGRVYQNKLFDFSGNLNLICHSFKNNDIVITKIERQEKNKWKILKVFNSYSILNELQDNLWRLSSIKADVDKHHWEVLALRSKIQQTIRNYFLKCGFIEIDTPILRFWEDMTNNTLFLTSLGSRGFPRLNLRSCPEEYIRRAVIPFFRAFEIGKSFRNEFGTNEETINKYLPEFTLIEFYETPADFENSIKRIEDMVLSIFNNLQIKKKIEFNGNVIDFEAPFKRIKVLDAIKEYCGENGRAFLYKLSLTKSNKQELFDELNFLIENKIKPKLINPTFLTHFPEKADIYPDLVENDLVLRAEFICGTIEVGEVGTLQANTDVLKKHIYQSIKDRHKLEFAANNLIDIDYITELKREIPPVGGGGLGLDRLLMVLTNNTDINNVVWYPFPIK